MGSIDVGKDADLAVFDGYPLGMFAKVVQTYVDGSCTSTATWKARQDAVAKEKAALMERSAATGRDPATPRPDRSPAGEEVVR